MGKYLFITAALLICIPVNPAKCEPSWAGTVVPMGEERTRIQATPIVARPNRPFHFYGNTARRLHFRGRWLPAPRDFGNGGRALIRNR
ncbi:MAG: hypothetical protein N2C14_20200 [Planctomycetales bacterium]